MRVLIEFKVGNRWIYFGFLDRSEYNDLNSFENRIRNVVYDLVNDNRDVRVTFYPLQFFFNIKPLKALSLHALGLSKRVYSKTLKH